SGRWVDDVPMTNAETPLNNRPTIDLGTFPIPDRLPLSTRIAVVLAAIGIAVATVIAFTAGLVVVAILFVVATIARLIARLGGKRHQSANAKFEDVRYIDLRFDERSDPRLN
ncbi:MAG: hypothetical protein OSA99_17335, partial [Acidimicrobiales bacterium]|nr:hypothetical protein [Acidimicrobiales bacterium]